MCLITKNKKPKIAKKDIVCYKVLAYIPETHIYVTPFTKTEVNPWPNNHFGTNREGLIGVYSYGFLKKEYEVNGGYIHTYKEAFSAIMTEHTIRTTYGWSYRGFEGFGLSFRCIIPKGTEYYEGVDSNGNKCYASKEIIFKP